MISYRFFTILAEEKNPSEQIIISISNTPRMYFLLHFTIFSWDLVFFRCPHYVNRCILVWGCCLRLGSNKSSSLVLLKLKKKYRNVNYNNYSFHLNKVDSRCSCVERKTADYSYPESKIVLLRLIFTVFPQLTDIAENEILSAAAASSSPTPE